MPRASLSAPHVLVVDADSRSRAEIAALVVGDGARATQAASAAEAMRHVGARRFDAVIVDYALPGVGGVVLVAQFRGLGNGRDLPAVVLSALPPGPGQEKARQHAACLPGTVFLERPVSGPCLAHVINGLLAPA